MKWGRVLFAAVAVVLIGGCAPIQDDFGPYATVVGDDARGNGVALLHADGTAEISQRKSVEARRFRQPSSDSVKVVELVDDASVRLRVGDHEFLIHFNQPFITDTYQAYVQMVKRVGNEQQPEVMRLSHAKAVNDSIIL